MRKATVLLALVALLIPAAIHAQNILPGQPAHAEQNVSFLKDKPVLALAAIQGGLNFADAIQTEHYWKLAQPTEARPIPGTFREYDPLVKPFIGHPVAYYSFVAGYVVTSAVLANRMRHSSNPVVRKLWRLPQAIGIGAGVGGFTFTRLEYKSG